MRLTPWQVRTINDLIEGRIGVGLIEVYPVNVGAGSVEISPVNKATSEKSTSRIFLSLHNPVGTQFGPTMEVWEDGQTRIATLQP